MFETNRCLIQTFGKFDFKDVRKLYLNPEVRKFLGGIKQEESIPKVLEYMLNPDADSYYWVVREKDTELFMGLVSLDPHHDGDYLEISYQFSPGWWGRGYGAEVVERVINYGLHELKLSKVVAETQTANIASCRLLESLGMDLERTISRFGAEQAIYSMKSSI
ncbi:GNAT family N-acetyltransferase [Lysinibacillus sp. SGAir0095]|uniref:GNAT family N-acetyltransferase n=1 Tax=Lysinibacillus sp. SGAir0095 TaxID=2070463 RepID=UPI0010CCD034|nr:GNAT family N-acetyltransferase [Lysinibacillus sp. SGAir0095]QCR31238.1 GNAT family N-acetyltransferase [Lysinibacillus sp. SGAir0095]